ncbi:hypothetical protein FHETE_10002 [Fusarium heterosporum]|uniref:Uncharacterized protein n=1 Tax=Fusarium heterosporum TaxID=42747 RepID=A0A8H5WHD9_FUSHE|nr:hypothetical protein FHETE_10002 [Fusarium heterosporum]
MDANAEPRLEGVAPKCRVCSSSCRVVQNGWTCTSCETPYLHLPLSINGVSTNEELDSRYTTSRDIGFSMQGMSDQSSTDYHSIVITDGSKCSSQLNGDMASQVSQSQDPSSVPPTSRVDAFQGNHESVAQDFYLEENTPGSNDAGSDESGEPMELDRNDENFIQEAIYRWSLDRTAVGMGARSSDVEFALGLVDRFDLIPCAPLNGSAAVSELDVSDEMDMDE